MTDDTTDSAEAVLRDAVAADVDDPCDPAYDGTHLWSVYNDGEVTSQKAGCLWKRRSEHLIVPGVPEPHPRSLIALPRAAGDPAFAYVVVSDYATALALRDRIVRTFGRRP